MVQKRVLGARADLRGDRDRADRGPRTEEPHWAGDTASVEAGDGQGEDACDPLLPVIERPNGSALPVVARHVVVALLHLDVPVHPVLRAQLQLVHHVDAVHAGDGLVEVAQVGRVVRLDTEQGVKRWVPDGRVAAAVLKSVEPKVLAPREAGDAAGVEAGEAVLVTVWVTAAPGVAFGG